MRKLTILFTLLTLSVGLVQAECVFTYTATVMLDNYFLTSINFGYQTPSSHTFDEDTNTGTVKFDDNVTTIGEEAFKGCNVLQSISLPASITTIGDNAFYECRSLTEVTVAWTEATKIPVITNNVFEKIAKWKGPSDATLHVPNGTKALYEAADVWKNFGTIDDPLALAQARAVAITEINMAAEDAKAEIDKASTYSAADAVKAEYKTKIDIAVAEAEDDIERASTIAEVDEQKSIYIYTLIKNIVANAKATIASINALEEHRAQVIGEIENARTQAPLPELDEEQKAYLNEIIDDAVNAVKAATTTTEMDRAEAKIFFILSIYPAGKAEGLAEAQTALPTEGVCGNTVIIIKGEKRLELYNVDNVEYKITECEN